MKKFLILTLLCVCALTETFAISKPEENPNKLVLSGYLLKDAKIGHLTSDISNFIFRKKNGYLWPVTKVLFSKDKGVLTLNITAIDNEWNKLQEPGEKTYGYFVVNNRIFIISTKDNEQIDFSEYFESEENSERTFACSESKKLIKNPQWVYTVDADSTFPKQIKAVNIEALGR